MHIHEIIIDGFKSYAKRTVISGFDPQFNAITGLNGTGKSNILDSICFVLGITNLSEVRAGNLQDLVYKQGQAGVTKASVTIVFNNSDTENSPISYESSKQITVTRQVVIGGKNKYMINGRTVQPSDIKDMFHSVQLNVNNPHFLIMQGRITKVLNMKPVEILSMIEEAAGTRMFQTKKEAALKTIEKKQQKVDELSKCMDDKIGPEMEGLRDKLQQYTVFTSNATEHARLERFCIASNYKDLQENITKYETGKQVICDELHKNEAIKTDKKNEAEECGRRIEAINAVLKEGMKEEFLALKQNEEDLGKALVKVKTLLKNQTETLLSEKEVAVTLESQVLAAKDGVASKEAELVIIEKEVSVKEGEVAVAEKDSIQMRDKHQNALAGVADENSAEVLSLPEQVALLEKRAREALSSLQQGAQKTEYTKSKLKDLRSSAKAQSSAHAVEVKEAEILKAAITAFELKAKDGNYNAKEEEALRMRVSQLQTSTSNLKDEVDRITTQLEARLNFDFKDPERGFDRSKVKGLVARLVKVTNSLNATALEVAAGTKLYQVVVDNEQTGKLLLQKGGLRNRVTILPLNRISSKCTDAARVTHAKEIAAAKGATANLALELVGFEEEVRKAMEYTFGNVIICDNSEVAKEIAFDKKVRNRTVTLEGDSFDPSGVMTGGSLNQIGSLLSKITDLASATSALELQMKELQVAESALQRMEAKGAGTRAAERDLDLKRHALRMCTDKLADSSYTQTVNDVTAMEVSLVALEQDAVTLQATHVKATQDLKNLKEAANDIKKLRDNAMKNLEIDMKKSQKAVTVLREALMKIHNKRDGITAELAGNKKDLSALQEQVSVCGGGITRYEKDVAVLASQLSDLKTKYSEAQTSRNEKEYEIAARSTEIKQIQQLKIKCEKLFEDATVEVSKITNKIASWTKNGKDAKASLASLEKEHPWIANEKSFFGQKDSDFDFEKKDVAECRVRLQQLTAEQDKLKNKVNAGVMGRLENAESEYIELSKKKMIIMNDKVKIEAVIDELDKKKAQALQTTWIKVNRDFGSIFTMLLPGTMAKLEPPEGGSVMDGLDVKVAFNGVWKESLTELSGGQRSLLALSLILSLLLFKPAPMYILDEVDAALDLSHTQNIGMMLRTHFSASQFIVVSLKEGMFNNANVIFRTRFVDGVSAVTRTVVGGKNRPVQPQLQDTEEEAVAPLKKKGKVPGSKAPSSAKNTAQVTYE